MTVAKTTYGLISFALQKYQVFKNKHDTPSFWKLKMKDCWKTFIFLVSFAVKVECDVFNELLLSVKNLHEKVDKISDMVVQNGMEQIRTNEIVEQLQTDLKNLSLELKLKQGIDFNDKLALNNSSPKTLTNKIVKIDGTMDKANEANLQKLTESVVDNSNSSSTKGRVKKILKKLS